MRIAIDATAIPVLKAGAGVYTDELVRSLLALDREDTLTVFVRGHAFTDLPRQHKNLRLLSAHVPTRIGRFVWEQTLLPVLLRRLRIDVLHSPHHTTPVAPLPCRRVVTIHDVTFYIYPGRYGPARRLYMRTTTRLSLQLADAIIVPSATVRDDLHRLLGVSPSRVRVVPEGVNPRFQPPSDESHLATIRARYAGGEPYILNVGSLEPGKNQTTLVRAYRRLRDRGYRQRLVIAGQRAWRYQPLIKLRDELGLTDVVHLAGYVPAPDLPALYGGADLFVFPSLYEGFGLPVLEAMACGTPVVCSNRGALPELVAGAALVVNPYRPRDLTEAMALVLDTPELREQLRRAGRERASQFTWEHTAADTLSLYRRVIQTGTA